MIFLADESSSGACCCCLLVIIIFAVFIMFGSSGSDSDSSDIVVDNSLPPEETLPILNKTNITLKPSKITFVYYDHNSSKFEGCYGLNYTVLSDKNGDKFMLDHAETDILGNATNYTFTYPEGVGLVYDNNTETEIYENLGCYYVHEIRDDNGTVIKPLGNYTLNDKSHEPDIIPSDWYFVYKDHNSTTYDGDEGLICAFAVNNKNNESKLVKFYDDADIIGLAYNSPKFDYKYGLSGIRLNDVNDSEGNSIYTASSRGLCYPNGTRIETFNIESYNLNRKQKDFITNYDDRIDDVRHKQEIDAVYDAEDMYYSDYVRYNEYSKDKSKFSYYLGSGGSGVIYTPY